MMKQLAIRDSERRARRREGLVERQRHNDAFIAREVFERRTTAVLAQPAGRVRS
jgi:hypothetical protein